MLWACSEYDNGHYRPTWHSRTCVVRSPETQNNHDVRENRGKPSTLSCSGKCDGYSRLDYHRIVTEVFEYLNRKIGPGNILTLSINGVRFDAETSG